MRRAPFSFVVVVALVLLGANAFSQQSAWWPAPRPILARIGSETFEVGQYASFRANAAALRDQLESAPREGSREPGQLMWFPSPDGTVRRFRVFESPIQTPEVERQTGVKTYSAQGVDDPWETARLDIGPNGFHGMVLGPSGTYFIEPARLGERFDHVVFYKRDAWPLRGFPCTTDDYLDRSQRSGFPTPLRPGPNRKEYRLALKGTGEYTQFYGSVTNADNGSVTVMNRVNGVYERDIAIRMIIVNLVNYPNPNTDPYTNNNGVTMLGQNQTTCDIDPGDPNYDIGHVFSTGGGGVAGLRVVGITGQKARGVTGLPSPIGDPFAIDYVAHEMGHQYGANHTFNGTTGSCGGGNRSAANAYEPGSGSTIMAYAGICGSENLQNFSDDYFHINSQSAIESWRNNASSGGTLVSTGNNSPVVNAGADYTIPQDTPFRLTATASDPDGDPLTYCWEQYDLGTASPTTDESTRPLFRSLLPSTSPTRWFPKQSTVLANVFDQWENLPSVNRTMNFRCTVRDNRAGGGNFEWDAMVITVSGTPFFVTAPNTSVVWTGGTPQTVTWNVGGGIVAPNVRILLSTDGGASYYNGTATVLVASTPNDGSENVIVPNVSTTQARIIVEAVGNIFYDVSNVNFTIVPGVQVVNPSAYTVTEGNEPVHNLGALLQSDDVRLEVRSNSANLSTTIVEVTGTSPTAVVSRLSFILECQANDPNRIRNIDLWNWTTSQWETVSTTTGTLTDSTVTVDITSNPGRFINATTREMRARARKQSPTISRTFSRVVDFFDRMVWEIAP